MHDKYFQLVLCLRPRSTIMDYKQKTTVVDEKIVMAHMVVSKFLELLHDVDEDIIMLAFCSFICCF